jgi:hypothetical protein
LANDQTPTPDKEAQEATAEQSLFGRVTRRSFLSHLGAAGIAATGFSGDGCTGAARRGRSGGGPSSGHHTSHAASEREESRSSH